MTSTTAATLRAFPRVILPVSEWPSIDREQWLDCCTGRGPQYADNRAMTWSHRRRKIVEDAYGRFLGWSRSAGNLEAVLNPASRITPATLAAFVKHMSASGLASVSVGMQAGAIASIAQAFAPGVDWTWLRHKYWRLKTRATPSRMKRARVVPSSELAALGINLMETATKGSRHTQPFFAASQYRDGLIIALMASRPLRIRNFQDIEILRTLIYRSGSYFLVFDEEETKTGKLIDVVVPKQLTPYMDTYLARHRTLLLSKRPKGTSPTMALWVSRSGLKMQEAAMRTNIKSRTKGAFGRAINPHLFRDCAATSFATDDPEHVRCIAPLLSHTTMATSDKHYNQATMLTAARTFSATIMKLRHELLNEVDDEATRAFLLAAQQRQSNEEGI